MKNAEENQMSVIFFYFIFFLQSYHVQEHPGLLPSAACSGQAQIKRGEQFCQSNMRL